jgi:hypothetical protein
LVASAMACAWLAPAMAQTGDAALAESLFREGKRLLGEHKYAEACPKFEESYKLDHGLGTLLNLASCHESAGKPASAWAEFSEAAARAKRDNDNDRAQLAEDHVKALEPKLAHVSIAISPGASVPGLVVKFDSRELSSAALGVQIPVDPGTHVVEASAPGKQTYSQTFTTPVTATVLAITVPALGDAPGAAPSAVPLPAAAPAATTQATPPDSAPPQASSSSGSRTPLIVSGVATGVFAVGTIVTAVLYSSKRSAFNSANNADDAQRNDKRDSAQTAGTVNLVFTGATLISAGLFGYFLATGSHESAPAASARTFIAPVLSPNGGGILLRGSL